MGTLMKFLGIAALLVGLAAPAHADLGPDERFWLLLANSGLDRSSLPLYKQQALEGCQRMANGESMQTVVKDANRATGTSLARLLAIYSAGITVYCPKVPG